MTSKNLYFKLMRQDIKRRFWTAALAALVFFFIFPVSTALMSGDPYLDIDYLRPRLANYLSVSNGWMILMTLISPLIFGVTSFSYLHSRQKTDFYHSIPVRRGKLFAVNCLDGVLIYGAVYLINLAAALVIASVRGAAAPELLFAALRAYLFYMVHFALMYSVVILSMMLTGHILVGLLGTAVFNFYGPTLALVIEGYYSAFFDSAYRGSSNSLEFIFRNTSPVAFFVDNYDHYDSGSGLLGLALAMVAVLAVTAVSLRLYRSRKSEAAGKAMAFSWSKPLIRIPIVVLSALLGGLVFWGMQRGMGWPLFGMACGLLISHGVIEIIYHFDLKKLFSHRVQLVSCALAALALFCVFRYDLLGYNKPPKAERLQSVAVSTDIDKYWITYGAMVSDSYGDTYWEDRDLDAYIFNHMKLTDYDTVSALVSAADAWSEEEYGSEEGPLISFSVDYVLKNGNSRQRSHRLSLSAGREALSALYQEPEFKRGTYPIFSQTPEETVAVYVKQQGNLTRINSGGNPEAKEKRAELLAAYQQDLLEQTFDDRVSSVPVATIQFTTEDLETSGQKDNLGFYPVYPAFDRTMELLEQYHVFENSDSSIYELVISPYSYLNYYAPSRYDESESDVRITDPADIASIMEAAVPTEYCRMNRLYNTDKRVYPVKTGVRTENGTFEYFYLICEEDIPPHLMSGLLK